jgi:hypothetical protein
MSGVMLKTTNAGASWDSLTSGTTNSIFSVHFPVDAQTGYAVGDMGTILVTTNGGGTWVSQVSGTTNHLGSVYFPVNTQTGYVVGETGTILKCIDGGSWVEEERAGTRDQGLGIRVTARPNPLTSFAIVPGHEAERFALYDVSGRKVGTFKGNRIGEGLSAGVYFVRSENQSARPLRIVKVR